MVVATVTTEILSYALTHPSPPFTIQQPARIIMSGPPASGKTFAAKNMVQLSCFERKFEHIYVIRDSEQQVYTDLVEGRPHTMLDSFEEFNYRQAIRGSLVVVDDQVYALRSSA